MWELTSFRNADTENKKKRVLEVGVPRPCGMAQALHMGPNVRSRRRSPECQRGGVFGQTGNAIRHFGDPSRLNLRLTFLMHSNGSQCSCRKLYAPSRWCSPELAVAQCSVPLSGRLLLGGVLPLPFLRMSKTHFLYRGLESCSHGVCSPQRPFLPGRCSLEGAQGTLLCANYALKLVWPCDFTVGSIPHYCPVSHISWDEKANVAILSIY